MSGAREQVLGRVRKAVQGEGRSASATAELEARLAAPKRGLIPSRVDLPHAELCGLFESMAIEAASTVARLADASAVPAAVAAFLKRENLPSHLRLAPDPALTGLPWEQAPLIEVATGRAEESDQVSLTTALAGIAETGTLMLASGPSGPTTLNFLPETHIVMLEAAQIVGSYEDAWSILRARYGPGEMPRTVNLITGPSRSGDIEQTILLGAHGPRRLHILLVGDAADGKAP